MTSTKIAQLRRLQYILEQGQALPLETVFQYPSTKATECMRRTTCNQDHKAPFFNFGMVVLLASHLLLAHKFN